MYPRLGAVWRRFTSAIPILALATALVVSTRSSHAATPARAQLQTSASLRVTYPNGGISYSPKQATIDVGDEVEWQGQGADFTSHPLVSDEGLWPVQTGGATFTFKFTQPGLYHYHCQVHGPFGMTGTVLVAASHVYLPEVTH